VRCRICLRQIRPGQRGRPVPPVRPHPSPLAIVFTTQNGSVRCHQQSTLPFCWILVLGR